ncbi:MAG TPA: dUTP diphosphatase [Firmicutes bacterium]|jgi:dUTP pyrophosphatase|nr:dUTP diphosphatase [Bacillota bacterium]
MNPTLKVKLLSPEAKLPEYAHEGDAGLDLFSVDETVIAPGEVAAVGTGISIELPPNTEGQVRPRSGLALKHQITVLNSPGTIDQGYRGEIKVLLFNCGKEPFSVTKGMKIAQLVVAPVHRVKVETTDSLSDTARQDGGFGSTGL